MTEKRRGNETKLTISIQKYKETTCPKLRTSHLFLIFFVVPLTSRFQSLLPPKYIPQPPFMTAKAPPNSAGTHKITTKHVSSFWKHLIRFVYILRRFRNFLYIPLYHMKVLEIVCKLTWLQIIYMLPVLLPTLRG